MLYAIINTMQVGTLQQLFPQTSFPSSGPDESWLRDHGCVSVAIPNYDGATQKLIACEPYADDNGSISTYVVQQLTDQELYDSRNPDWSGFRQALAESEEINLELASSYAHNPIATQIFTSHILGVTTNETSEIVNIACILLQNNYISLDSMERIKSLAISYFIPASLVDSINNALAAQNTGAK